MFFMRFGLATSASTRSTVLSTSDAMLIARFRATKVLPSLGRALVTITQLERSTVDPDPPWAFLMIGRFMTRNSSAIFVPKTALSGELIKLAEDVRVS